MGFPRFSKRVYTALQDWGGGGCQVINAGVRPSGTVFEVVKVGRCSWPVGQCALSWVEHLRGVGRPCDDIHTKHT